MIYFLTTLQPLAGAGVVALAHRADELERFGLDTAS